MTKREPKYALNALDIIGMIFAPLGAVLIAVGRMITAIAESHPENTTGDPRLFFWIFGGIGAVFLLLGLIFLALMFRRRSIQRRIFAEGNYIMAAVTSVQPNYNVCVNGKHPYVAECSYTDPETGVLHLFRSRNIYFDPTSILMDANVPVYIERGNFRHYYVDVDALLPEVQKH